MSWPIIKMTCIEWIEISMVDHKRERDVVKHEASSSRSGGSYVLGRSRNRSHEPILGDVKTLEDN